MARARAIETIRSFIAVVLGPAVRSALAEEIERLRGTGTGVAWVAPENLHVTLKFLGWVEPPRLELVDGSLDRAVTGMAPFDLSIEALGAFPTPTRPRVIWAGIADGKAELAALADRVERELSALGFAGEERAFSPHVTLGRVKEPRKNPDLGDALAMAAGRRFGTVPVDRVVLMRSDLSPRGARYTELSSHGLA